MRNLIVGSITIPVQSLGPHSQTYSTQGGRTRLRMMDGSQVGQTRWSKLSTTISSTGLAPAGLASIDPATAVSVSCLAPRSLSGSSNVIVLPSARRSDEAPRGYAIVNGSAVPTPLTIATNTATLTTVSGASGYRCDYWPMISAYCEFTESTSNGPAGFGWTLTCEEA